VSEAIFNAAVAGHFNVPLIMVAGDQNVTKKAVQGIAGFKPYIIKPPVRMELTFKNTFDAEAMSYLPWVKRQSGKTILVEANNMLDINRFITALFRINTR
jgi:D-aminopeptidase